MNVVFLHGFLGAPSDWDGVTAELSPKYDCHFSVCDTVHALVGYSMGGRIAMGLAYRLPIHRLVLIGAHPGLKTEKEREERLRFENHWLSILENEPLDSFLKKWYAMPLFGNLSIPKERFFLNKDEVRRTFLEFSLVKQPSFWENLALPFLYIAGEQDAKYRDIGEKLVALNPSGRLVIVEGASHAVHLEKPKRVKALIEEFI